MGNTLYTLYGIRHRYSSFVLDIPELDIHEGKSIGFTGPNGSGKSTLLRILSFLEKPQKGSVLYKGREMQGSTGLTGEVTLLQQDPYLLKRTVFDNVAYGLKVRGKTRNIRQTVFDELHNVGLAPEKFAERKWFELSGGEAQRVALAARLILSPAVLILDEPTANIDRNSSMLVKDAAIKMHRENGTTLIISSHDHVWLNRIADEIYRLHDGRIAGKDIENILEGPWLCDEDGLWRIDLGAGEKIYALKPPSPDSIALLGPSDIILSNEKPSGVSAQNILRGSVISINAAREAGKIKVYVECSGTTFICNITPHAAHDLKLIPGRDVWLMFKASAFKWK